MGRETQATLRRTRRRHRRIPVSASCAWKSCPPIPPHARGRLKSVLKICTRAARSISQRRRAQPSTAPHDMRGELWPRGASHQQDGCVQVQTVKQKFGSGPPRFGNSEFGNQRQKSLMSRPYSEPLTGGRVLSRDLPSSPSHVNSHSQASLHSALQPKPLERVQNWGKITSKLSAPGNTPRQCSPVIRLKRWCISTFSCADDGHKSLLQLSAQEAVLEDKVLRNSYSDHMSNSFNQWRPMSYTGSINGSSSRPHSYPDGKSVDGPTPILGYPIPEDYRLRPRSPFLSLPPSLHPPSLHHQHLHQPMHTSIHSTALP
jgi:hypothetical protein